MKYLICFFLIIGCQQKAETPDTPVEVKSVTKVKTPTEYFHTTLRDCLEGQEKSVCIETLEFHLTNGANINAPDDTRLGLPPVHWAILSRNKDMLEYLLAKGAGVNTKSEGTIYPGLTPLGFLKNLEEKAGTSSDPLFEKILKKAGGK